MIDIYAVFEYIFVMHALILVSAVCLTFRSALVLRTLHCAKFISACAKRHSNARTAKADKSGWPEPPSLNMLGWSAKLNFLSLRANQNTSYQMT